MPRLKLSPILEKITNIYVQKVPMTVIERTKAHINNDALNLITNIGDDMREHIGNLLKEGEEHGRSIAATASKLLTTGLDKGVFKSARKRAYLIARTELHRARQEAAVDIYKAAKIEMVKWVGIPDDGRICEKCAALHGKNFNIDNVEQYPPLHPRCRCRLLPADYQLDIQVKKYKKQKALRLKLLPNPKDYKYVVKIKKFKKALEKAVPYTQTRRGRLVHVRGYQGKPRLHDLSPNEKVEKYLMASNPQVERALLISSDIQAAGGHALFVGGSVRDALLGRRSKDIDIEVYGIKPVELSTLLQKQGKVDQVGKSFGVFKVSTDSGTFDVSVPRRESKVGKGHKGFMVEHDPTMTYKEAAGRRDLTINSLAYDPLERRVVDEYGGLQDIKDKVLRATDPKTFGDDSLRVLRVMRFAAQLGFTPDLSLVRLCRKIDLTDLPKERVFGELEGMLLKSKTPSIGLRLMPLLGIDKILPELTQLKGVEQEPDWHPEGDAWTHTWMVVDEAAKMRDRLPDPKERLIFMLSALCHDLGKPDTTEIKDGKIISHAHDEVGARITADLLKNRLTDDQYIIDKVESLVRHHMRPTFFFHDKVPDSAIRRLAKKVDVPMVVMLSIADKAGRGLEKTDLKAERWLMDRFNKIGLQHPEALNPKVMGRHLIPLGIQPGIEMGRLLDKIYNAQLDGKFNTTEEGLEYSKLQGWFDKPLTKSRVHKYIKRTGVPGRYRYTYMKENPNVTREDRLLNAIYQKDYQKDADIMIKENNLRGFFNHSKHTNFKVRESVQKEIDVIKEKIGFDGHKQLQLIVEDIDIKDEAKGYLRAFYTEDDFGATLYAPAIILDKKFVSSLAHEYGHYVFFHRLTDHRDRGLLKLQRWGDEGWGNKLIFHEASKDKDTFKSEYLKNYFDEMDKKFMKTAYTMRPRLVALGELIKSLKNLYVNTPVERVIDWNDEKAPENLRKLQVKIIYLLEPTEMFARAVDTYVHGKPGVASKGGFNKLYENNPKYYAIVKAWGDRYLKTGIIKSLFSGFTTLEKARSHKYIKREGGSKHYKYTYKEPEGKTLKMEDEVPKMAMCYQCGGKGKFYAGLIKKEVPCPVCKGTGEVPEKEFKHYLAIKKVKEEYRRRHNVYDKTFKMERPMTYDEAMNVVKEQRVTPEVSKFMKKYNVRDFFSKNPKLAIEIVEKDIQKWSDKFHFDGRGKLEIEIKTFPAGKTKTVKARYVKIRSRDPIEGVKQIIQIDKRYAESIPHEYAHFLFDDNGWLNRFSDSVIYGLDKEGIEKGFDRFGLDFGESIKGKPHEEEGKAVVELFNSLKSFYSSDEFLKEFEGGLAEIKKTYIEPYKRGALNQYYRWETSIKNYIFQPTEIFARVCEAYAHDRAPHSVRMSVNMVVVSDPENKESYMTIIRTWGDKYLKTGIIKSLGGDMTRLYLDPAKAKAIIKSIRKAREMNSVIPTKEGWAKKTTEGLILKRMTTKGDEILIKGGTAFVTAVGKDGCIARDEYGNKHQVLHKDVKILSNKIEK